MSCMREWYSSCGGFMTKTTWNMVILADDSEIFEVDGDAAAAEVPPPGVSVAVLLDDNFASLFEPNGDCRTEPGLVSLLGSGGLYSALSSSSASSASSTSSSSATTSSPSAFLPRRFCLLLRFLHDPSARTCTG